MNTSPYNLLVFYVTYDTDIRYLFGQRLYINLFLHFIEMKIRKVTALK